MAQLVTGTFCSGWLTTGSRVWSLIEMNSGPKGKALGSATVDGSVFVFDGYSQTRSSNNSKGI